MNTIEFVYEKNESISLIRKLLNEKNYAYKEADINKGLGIKFSGTNPQFTFVLYFKQQQSSKIVFEKSTPEFESIFSMRAAEASLVNATTPKLLIQKVPVYATFHVSPINMQKIQDEITSNFEHSEIVAQKSTIAYSTKLSRGLSSLTVTQFTNGTFLIQGVDSELVNEVKVIINKYDQISEIDDALTYIEDSKKRIVAKALEVLFTQYPSLSQIAKDKLTDEVLAYLYTNDAQLIVSAIGVIEAVRKSEISLPLYNPVIYPFSKAFEGFIIKMMIDKCFFTYEKYQAEPEIAKIGNALREKKFDKYIKDIVRNGTVLSRLQSVWESLRCGELHSDPAINPEIQNLQFLGMAENKVGEICSVMIDAYRIIVKEGFTEAEMLANRKATSNSTTSSNKNEIKEIPVFTSHIGTDESGKGDYFGPLVIAGVFVNKEDEAALEGIGVCDSKNNSDSKNLEIASKIIRLMGLAKISVIVIGNERYNELYESMGRNLNSILGWGHARAIENILSKNICENAIADQFGNESVINEALMSKGKTIKLLQTPKGERDIAVAAASILARSRFIQELAKLSKEIGFELSKGASPLVEEEARRIVTQKGRQTLNRYAKVHFKTTSKL